MRRNLGITRGAIMAEAVMMELAPRFGHEGAHRIVAGASRLAAEAAIALDSALLQDAAVAALYAPADLARLVHGHDAYLGAT